jgi:hypothetical protein
MMTPPDNCYWIINNDPKLVHENGNELEKNGFLVVCILPMCNVLCIKPNRYLDAAPNEQMLKSLPFIKNFKWMANGAVFPTPGLSN